MSPKILPQNSQNLTIKSSPKIIHKIRKRWQSKSCVHICDSLIFAYLLYWVTGHKKSFAQSRKTWQSKNVVHICDFLIFAYLHYCVIKNPATKFAKLEHYIPKLMFLGHTLTVTPLRLTVTQSDASCQRFHPLLQVSARRSIWCWYALYNLLVSTQWRHIVDFEPKFHFVTRPSTRMVTVATPLSHMIW